MSHYKITDIKGNIILDNDPLRTDNNVKAISVKDGYEYRNNYGTGVLHREDGPAKDYHSGFKKYYRFGIVHRSDGPAIIYADGTKEYFINGKQVNPFD